MLTEKTKKLNTKKRIEKCLNFLYGAAPSILDGDRPDDDIIELGSVEGRSSTFATLIGGVLILHNGQHHA